MKISAKTEYAGRALLELGLRWPGPELLQIGFIALKRQIPMKFLPHILLELKQMGLVESVLGQKGGYRLARPPQEVRLLDVLEHFGEIKFAVKPRRDRKVDVLQTVFQQADDVLAGFFKGITLEELIQRERSSSAVPMYTI